MMDGFGQRIRRFLDLIRYAQAMKIMLVLSQVRYSLMGN